MKRILTLFAVLVVAISSMAEETLLDQLVQLMGSSKYSYSHQHSALSQLIFVDGGDIYTAEQWGDNDPVNLTNITEFGTLSDIPEGYHLSMGEGFCYDFYTGMGEEGKVVVTQIVDNNKTTYALVKEPVSVEASKVIEMMGDKTFTGKVSHISFVVNVEGGKLKINDAEASLDFVYDGNKNEYVTMCLGCKFHFVPNASGSSICAIIVSINQRKEMDGVLTSVEHSNENELAELMHDKIYYLETPTFTDSLYVWNGRIFEGKEEKSRRAVTLNADGDDLFVIEGEYHISLSDGQQATVTVEGDAIESIEMEGVGEYVLLTDELRFSNIIRDMGNRKYTNENVEVYAKDNKVYYKQNGGEEAVLVNSGSDLIYGPDVISIMNPEMVDFMYSYGELCIVYDFSLLTPDNDGLASELVALLGETKYSLVGSNVSIYVDENGKLVHSKGNVLEIDLWDLTTVRGNYSVETNGLSYTFVVDGDGIDEIVVSGGNGAVCGKYMNFKGGLYDELVYLMGSTVYVGKAMNADVRLWTENGMIYKTSDNSVPVVMSESLKTVKEDGVYIVDDFYHFVVSKGAVVRIECYLMGYPAGVLFPEGATGIDSDTVESGVANVRKVIENGRVVIIRNGDRYDLGGRKL